VSRAEALTSVPVWRLDARQLRTKRARKYLGLEPGIDEHAVAVQVLGGATYANTPHPAVGFWTDEADQRLRRIKANVDPCDVIRANHPIPPAAC
jgi:hypothetical protein